MAVEKLQVKHGNFNNLPNKEAGSILFTIDTNQLFLDYAVNANETSRIEISDVIIIESKDINNKIGIEKKIYITSDTNEIYFYYNNRYNKLSSKINNFFNLSNIDLTSNNTIEPKDINYLDNVIGALIIDKNKSLGIITSRDNNNGKYNVELLIDKRSENVLMNNDAIYIDSNYAGTEQIGTLNKPFNSFESLLNNDIDLNNRYIILLSEQISNNTEILINNVDNLSISGCDNRFTNTNFGSKIIFKNIKKITCNNIICDPEIKTINCNEVNFLNSKINNLSITNSEKINIKNCNLFTNLSISNDSNISTIEVDMQNCYNIESINIDTKNNATYEINLENIGSCNNLFINDYSDINKVDTTSHNIINLYNCNINDEVRIKSFDVLTFDGGYVGNTTITGIDETSTLFLGTCDFKGTFKNEKCKLKLSGLQPNQIKNVTNNRNYENSSSKYTGDNDEDNLKINLDAIDEKFINIESRFENINTFDDTLVFLSDKGIISNMSNTNEDYTPGSIVKYIGSRTNVNYTILNDDNNNKIQINNSSVSDSNYKITMSGISHFCKAGNVIIITDKNNVNHNCIVVNQYTAITTSNHDYNSIIINSTDTITNIKSITYTLQLFTNDRLIKLQNGWDKLNDYLNENDNYQIVKTKNDLSSIEGANNTYCPVGTIAYVKDDDSLYVYKGNTTWKQIITNFTTNTPMFKDNPQRDTESIVDDSDSIVTSKYVKEKTKEIVNESISSTIVPVFAYLQAGDNLVSLNIKWTQSWQFIGTPMCYSSEDMNVPVDFKILDKELVDKLGYSAIKINVDKPAYIQFATMVNTILPQAPITNIDI